MIASPPSSGTSAIFDLQMPDKKITEAEFKRLSNSARWQCVRKHGTEVSKRHYRGFAVRLFAIGSFYSEVWSRLGIDMVEWVEVIPLDRVADIYGPELENIDQQK
jgi:hypothetical protein